MGGSRTGTSAAALMGLVAIVVGVGWSRLPKRDEIPAFLKHQPLKDMGRGFLSNGTIEGLLNLSRRVTPIHPIARDFHAYTVLADNIGEALPFDDSIPGNACPGAYMIPNKERNKCIFPGRLDVARHYMLSGGPEGNKEHLDVLTARLQSFQKLLFNWTEYEETKQLLQSDARFVGLAREVCPSDRKFLDQFQFGIQLQIPGQTISNHLDSPIFMRANRYTIPQWLLVMMVFSGLFQDDFVPQVQLVGYYHKWSDERGGKFFFWNDDEPMPKVSDPVSGSANAVDGSKVVHAAAIYMPWRRTPPMPRSARNLLHYTGFDEARQTHRWAVSQDGEEVQGYDEDELRFSAVYRGRCFKDAAERDEFHRKIKEEPWTPEEVLTVFERDMKAKGRWPFGASETVYDRTTPEDRYRLGLAVMDQYLKYPWSPTAWIPLNYCAVSKLVPALEPLLRWVC